MLHRLRVQGYKTLQEADAAFAPLTVILGPNATGKSNLADFIDLLSALVRKETLRDAFEDHRGRPLEAFHAPAGFSEEGYAELERRGTVRFSARVDLELSERVVGAINDTLEERERVSGTKAPYTRVSEKHLRYELAISMDVDSGKLFVEDESLVALRKTDLEPSKARSPFIQKEQVEGSGERFVLRLERQGHPRYFEARGRHRTLLSEVSDVVYHPHVVAARREIGSWRTHYVEPSAMRTPPGVQHATDPGRHGELLAPYFNYLQHEKPRLFRTMVENLRQLVPTTRDLIVRPERGILQLWVESREKGEFPARLLSEGTLRLLCLLAIVVSPDPPGLVVYEEPENGVNPARIAQIVEVLRSAAGRADPVQFLVTTHSLELAELAGAPMLKCEWAPGTGTRFLPLEWEKDGLFSRHELREALDERMRFAP